MVKKKIDSRVRVLIENGVKSGHRSFFVLVGDKGRDQIVNLHYMLSKATVRARPSVLWCYKKDLGFTTHRKKRMKEIKKKLKSGLMDADKEDPFELFIAATDIRYCYYSETHKILGSTYGMLVLQDFEAMTPNLLARTIETVEGGGIVVVLMRSVKSVKQLYSMSMDVHSRYRTEAHQDVVPRFNERLLLSLKNLKSCLMLDDSLDVLPWAKQSLRIEPLPPSEGPTDPKMEELNELKASLADTQPAGCLVSCAKTLDQATVILKFIEAISEKTLRSTVTLTAARGRGKSAALGLSIAAAIAYGYGNIFVTAPSPENLKTVFDFVFKGFDALSYKEHADYDIIQSSNPDFNKAVVRVNIFQQEHRQTIQYVQPQDAVKLGQAELLVIDEAAAIPLPLVRELLGPYLVFMASTVNGYEGTGRSLSLKLIQQLRKQSGATTDEAAQSSASGRVLREVALETPIRYQEGDAVEKWLNSLLCLDAKVQPAATTSCPHPSKCDLYHVNRETLFSYNKVSEVFLQRLMALYVASHYKNTPNDLQMLSDAPAHRIFCLLGPFDPKSGKLPEVLCVIQVALEGEISAESIRSSLRQGLRQSGDLIPWTVSQQFQDNDFGKLSGARIVRIATHPDYQSMGYGKRAVELLRSFYEGELTSLDEDAPTTAETMGASAADVTELAPRKQLPPLMLKLDELRPERLDYLGVSFGATESLFKFWKRCNFAPVYLRQTQNDLTGEHTCIMLRPLSTAHVAPEWLQQYWHDFQQRLMRLFPIAFQNLSPALALDLIEPAHCIKDASSGDATISPAELGMYLTAFDLKRLRSYSHNLVDFHVILDLVPVLATLWFSNKIKVSLSAVQKAILLGVGLQAKSIEDLAKGLSADVSTSHVMGLFGQMMRKLCKQLQTLQEKHVEASMPVEAAVKEMQPLDHDMEEEQEKAGQKVIADENRKIIPASLAQYAVDIEDDDLKHMAAPSGIVSIKRQKSKSNTEEEGAPKKKAKKVKGKHKGKQGKSKSDK